MNRREQLAYLLGLIEYSQKDGSSVRQAIDFADKNGIRANMNVGMNKEDFTEDKVAEWIMGQFIDGFNNGNFLAFNAGINIAHSFLNYDYFYRDLKDNT